MQDVSTDVSASGLLNDALVVPITVTATAHAFTGSILPASSQLRASGNPGNPNVQPEPNGNPDLAENSLLERWAPDVSEVSMVVPSLTTSDIFNFTGSDDTVHPGNPNVQPNGNTDLAENSLPEQCAPDISEVSMMVPSLTTSDVFNFTGSNDTVRFSPSDIPAQVIVAENTPAPLKDGLAVSGPATVPVSNKLFGQCPQSASSQW